MTCTALRRCIAVAALATAALVPPGCMSDPVVSMSDELHPAGGRYLVSATVEPWHRGYYSAAVSIFNETGKTLVLKPSMFRLEGTPPTGFVAVDRIPLMMGRAGYRMPARIESRCSAQGEIFFGIRGTETPKGPVRFIVSLPDGEHAFQFNFLE